MSNCPSCKALGESILVDGFTVYVCPACKITWYDAQANSGEIYQVTLTNNKPMNRTQVCEAVKGIIAYLEHSEEMNKKFAKGGKHERL
jgi:hypothetical protein